jgi:glycosyltransferase involved in cell wall biosynthesis
VVIIHVVAPAAVGGLERVVQALAAGQRRHGHRVAVMAVVAAADAADGFVAPLRAAGVEVLEAVLPGRGYLRERAALRRLCEALRPGVVHTHGYRPDVVDSGVARRFGAAAITTVHGFTAGDWKNRLYERLQVRAFRRFDAVVAVSRPQAERLPLDGVPRSRIHLVPNAWMGSTGSLGRAEARCALGVTDDAVLIGWVGRITRPKGPDVLVEALPLVPDRTARLVMLGDGPEQAALRDRAAALGVSDRIVWPGLVQDAARLFAAFDVLALSSRTEGTPIVLFEAMAAGVPIVATRVGGVPDVVGTAEALLVPPEDPVALADAIGEALGDRASAAARARAAQTRLAERFALEPWLARYEDVYGEARALVRAR